MNLGAINCPVGNNGFIIAKKIIFKLLKPVIIHFLLSMKNKESDPNSSLTKRVIKQTAA